MHYYAQINDDGVCFAVTQTSGPIDAPDMVPVDSADTTVLGMRWNGAAFVPADTD